MEPILQSHQSRQLRRVTRMASILFALCPLGAYLMTRHLAQAWWCRVVHVTVALRSTVAAAARCQLDLYDLDFVIDVTINPPSSRLSATVDSATDTATEGTAQNIPKHPRLLDDRPGL